MDVEGLQFGRGGTVAHFCRRWNAIIIGLRVKKFNVNIDYDANAFHLQLLALSPSTQSYVHFFVDHLRSGVVYNFGRVIRALA